MAKSYLYSAFGLIWNSIDLQLPELSEIKGNNDFDVKISQDSDLDWPIIKSSDYDTHTLKIAPNDLRLKINNIASSAPKAGKIVDEYIRDVKKEIEKEKKKLKSEEM